MIYCFDLDGTLCHTDGEDYAGATPNLEAIARVNRLFVAGHEVIIDTARGSGDHRSAAEVGELRALTVQQLARWSVAYTRLRVGHKIPADVYVDDRAVNVADWNGD